MRYVASATAVVAVGAGVGVYARIPASCKIATQTTMLNKTVAETVTEALVYPASLRAAAEARGLLIGSEAHEVIPEDARFDATLAREFNYLTAAGMSWAHVDCCGYKTADAVVRFASAHQMKVKGHPLIWHGSLPDWIDEDTSANTLRWTMQEHIREEVARYKGQVYAWNVVNEALESDGLRKTILLEKLGEDYIADAFRLALEADPNALLFYNDYGAEAAGGLQEAKSDRVYELVRKLVTDGVPIHGVDLQMHLFAPKP